jgi:hypothetical protein
LLVLRLLENPGVTAILGLVVGALLSMWSENRRWNREDRTRFHQDRIAVYKEYSKATAAALNPNYIEDEEAQKAREEAFEKAKDLYGDIVMLASGLEKTYQGVSQMNEALMNDAANARREFIYAARKELGGDTLPFESHKALEQASRQHQRKFWGT